MPLSAASRNYTYRLISNGYQPDARDSPVYLVFDDKKSNGQTKNRPSEKMHRKDQP